MNPVGYTRNTALPQVRVPDFRSPPVAGHSAAKAAVAGAPAGTAGAEETPRLRRISGPTGATSDAMLRYGSAAQIRSSSAAGSQIDVYI